MTHEPTPNPTEAHSRATAPENARLPGGSGDGLGRIARLAARLFDAPLAAIVIEGAAGRRVDAAFGMSLAEARTLLDEICPRTSHERPDAVVVIDTFDDPRFRDALLGLNGRPLRFLAAQTLSISNGPGCGAVWVFDHAPRSGLTREQHDDLRALAGLLQDELEMRRANRDLEKAGRDMSMILQVMPDVLIFAAPDRRITTVNRAFTEHFGYTEAEARGRTTAFLYAHPEDYARTGRRYNPKAPDYRSPYLIEYRRKDGSTFLGQTIGVHVRDDTGHTVGYLGITRDVTETQRLAREREEAQERLRRSEELLRETSHLALVGGGEYDARTGELFWSDELYRIYDLPVDRPMSVEDTLDFFDEGDRRRLEACVQQTLADGEPFELEMPMTTALGRSGWVRVKGSPIRDDDGTIVGVRGFHQDITEQRQAEQAKREFVSVVSHELRTPLTSIRGALSLVVHGVFGALPEEADDLLQIALKNTERLGLLVDDILDLERIEARKIELDMRPVDVADLIAGVLEANRAFADTLGVRLRRSIPHRPPRIFADPDKLHQVLTNLISNAVKYSPQGETVDVLVAAVPPEKLRLSVRDRGPGIPANFQPRLFERFTRADSSDTRRHPGTGLGLSIARALTEAMGGRIDYRTAPGEGTTMFVEFPILAEPEPSDDRRP